MSLSAGTHLGSYEIVERIGAGGMGEVYRAHDTRLKRDVALKVLPEAFANDSVRMVRFTREAQILASLNHPNIAAIYGVEDRAIVMELVEGETLAGPLPIETALAYARQIAEALEAAHEKGFIHRDLKPANVKVTPAGMVKVLDFGLAKLSEDPSAAADGTTSPTVTMSPTRAGWILGTAAYMAPEQARGKPVDRRADIWAFGAVLYEMLTGRQLFGGETVSDTLAAVLKTDPDWSLLPAETPKAIRRLLRRALERDRKRRLSDIADARLEIDEALAASADEATPDQPARGAVLPWSIAALAIVALGLVFALWRLREQPGQPAIVRFQIPAPERARFASGLGLSPDGRRLAFVAIDDNNRQMLWVRALDSLEVRALPGTEGAAFPFWSPDSRVIGFHAPGKLKKIEASGGPAQTICETTGIVTGGSWSREGTILYGTPNTGLFRVSQAGGNPNPLTALDGAHGETGHMRPWFLPDGRHFLYIAMNTVVESSAIYLASLDSKERKRLAFSQQNAVYAPPATASGKGHVFFLREDTLMAQRFDEKRLELSGEAFPVAEQVGALRALGLFSVSANGVLAHRSGGDSGNLRLVWFDRQGNPQGILGTAGLYRGVAISPDGSRVAVNRDDPGSANSDIWILDAERGMSPARITFGLARKADPVWSPNGKTIVFAVGGSVPVIYVKDYEKGANEQPLLKADTSIRPNDWSSDGRFLLFAKADSMTKWNLWTLRVGSLMSGMEAKPEPYLQTPFNESQGQFSPDGHWVAYTSDETGMNQIYVQSFPAGGGKFMISTHGATQPKWRGDGKELFYIAGDGKLMAVELKTTPAFQVGESKALFNSRISRTGEVANPFHYAVTAAGKRFLIISDAASAGTAPSPPITVVLNWTAGLKP